MSRKRQPVKAITRISKRFIRKFLYKAKKQIIWLLRAIFSFNRKRESANAGFVLPTVAMVSIVVVLLTTAIMFRSFERAKNASNVRVNEAVVSASSPALDRARAKISKLFADKSLPRATPADDALYNTLIDKIPQFTFGDETKLKLTYGTETLETAWKFPVDTDNNGKFDSYTLYGIYFKNPPVDGGQYSRARTPLEARTPPMVEGTLDDACGVNTSANLIGNTGWVKQNGRLKKSLFVYTATVPITSSQTGDFEKNKGNKGFSALEYQQDRVQDTPNNKAVVYEDDLEITPGDSFNLNGSIFTNSNLITGYSSGGIRLFQISSPASCFYEAKNAKITVGGNLGDNRFINDGATKDTKVDLFNGKGTNPIENTTISSKSVNETDNAKLFYNNLAYEQRINKLVTTQMGNGKTDPEEVINGIAKEKLKQGYVDTDFDIVRQKQLRLYFKKRTRRVPYKEVKFGSENADITAAPTPLLENIGTDNLRPNDKWIYPTDPADGITVGSNYTKLPLKTTGTSLEPKATEPKKVKEDGGKEGNLGDRILVGNNLPELWWDDNKKTFVGPGVEETQDIKGIKWNAGDTTKTRTRHTYVETLVDVGSTERDGEWESAAAQIPKDVTEPLGGLRVVTGAGIYLNKGGTPSSFTSTDKEIWPDTKPVPQAPEPTNKTIKPYWMYDYLSTDASQYASVTFTWPGLATADDKKPYLQMRATAVYHYKQTGYSPTNPKPIACVSSFYVPTNSTTAKNQPTYNSKTLSWNSATDGLSNNGIVYGAPSKASSDYTSVLTYQSQLKYPNGRLIDDGILATAIKKSKDSKPLKLSEQSALDAQICALQILDGSIGDPTETVIPHGAIREIAFLDARQIKQISLDTTTTNYDLPIKDRQPLEIRSTVLDLDLLRGKKIGTATPAQEYLLPNSGIIYATRDDALPDASAGDPSLSPVDYKLDTTRRPNGIMLVNGSKLGRESNYRDAEKGLILATNLPAYIKGDFNKHQNPSGVVQEEFTDIINDKSWTTTTFYTNRTKAKLNSNFACREKDPRLKDCTVGDEWRPATVLSDAITLLSGNFKEGFRDEGDYDWNDSYTAPVTLPTGLSKTNSYVPLAKWPDSTGKPRYFSSYLNNFVTPIVLRTVPGSYLTEVCTAINKADCSDPTKVKDVWTVQTACGGGGGNTYWNGKILGKNGGLKLVDGVVTKVANSRIKTGYVFENPSEFGVENKKDSPKCFADDAPRRLALVRNQTDGKLVSPLKVLGVNKSGDVQIFNFPNPGSDIMPPFGDISIPWLNPTTFKANGEIDKLEPILQLRQPMAVDPLDATNNDNLSPSNGNKNWLQVPAADTTFNLIVVTGDNPDRYDEDKNLRESNGGLHNLVRFLENWNPSGTSFKVNISGSFMQVKKSAYATGTFSTALSTSDSNLLYNNNISDGTGTGYNPPARQWGYDVALLSQSPDLFAQKLVLTPPDLPDEYYREVGRDDKWVQTLLCAKSKDDKGTADTSDDVFVNAVDSDQLPSGCAS